LVEPDSTVPYRDQCGERHEGLRQRVRHHQRLGGPRALAFRVRPAGAEPHDLPPVPPDRGAGPVSRPPSTRSGRPPRTPSDPPATYPATSIPQDDTPRGYMRQG